MNQPKFTRKSQRPKQLKFRLSSGIIASFKFSRESEAQTDPFTPEYVIEKENQPEVITIAHLTYGKGLPASMAEMELIEQMREKRAFDNALPPTSDEACFALRRKLMEE